MLSTARLTVTWKRDQTPPVLVPDSTDRRCVTATLLHGRLTVKDWDVHELTDPQGQNWALTGLLHRSGDQPSLVWDDGCRGWYQHGLLDRGHDKPAEIKADGTCSWYSDGFLHRPDHRPAVVSSCGVQQWWVHGIKYLSRHVTDFSTDSLRFAFVQAVVKVVEEPDAL